MGQSDPRAVPKDKAAIIADVTSRVTRYLAAQIIADPNFPDRESLPKPLPPPFCNFGHQQLFDYEGLVRIVWQVALGARAVALRSSLRWMPSITALTFVAGIVLSFSINPFIILLTGVLLLVEVIYMNLAMTEVRGAVAEVRAEALQQLLEDRFDKDESEARVEPHHIGNGALEGPELPVLTLQEGESPFPGFGQLRANHLYVCRPQSEGKPREVLELATIIREQVVAKAAEQLYVVMRHGEIIAVHGGDLSTNSRWLGADKAPVLWFPRAELERVQEVDPQASVRVFCAIQILFPHHMTTATIFFRVFPAGNSIAFQISVTTLGPPSGDLGVFRAQLSRYKLEKLERLDLSKTSRRISPAMRDAFEYLDRANLANIEGVSFQNNINVRELCKLDLSKEQHRGKEYDRLFQRIVGDSSLWPGRNLDLLLNLREMHSHSLPSGFFGRSEAFAQVHTLYDQIVRCALEKIDDGGFDVSDYRDKDGRFLIHSGKIDQLIIGEKVTIGKLLGAENAAPFAESQGDRAQSSQPAHAAQQVA